MKSLVIILLVLVIAFAWQIAAEGASARSRPSRDLPFVGFVPGPFVPRARYPDWRGPVYFNNSYYYPGYYYPYNPPLVVVSPYSSYYIPPTVVATLPYFCVLHQTGWVTRAGFLDHLAGTHKLTLESAASFCPDGFDSCLFPGY